MGGSTGGITQEGGAGGSCVLGTSMGGMIAPLIALEHPTRVRSLALLMTPSAGGKATMQTKGVGRRRGWLGAAAGMLTESAGAHEF